MKLADTREFSGSSRSVSKFGSSLKAANTQELTRTESEVMRREIADKQFHINQFSKAAYELTEMCQGLQKLILDLEESTDEIFLSAEQRNPELLPSANELTYVIRKALTTLVSLHKDLANRFEADFARKAADAITEIKAKKTELEELKQSRKVLMHETEKLEKLADFQRAEKESLEIMSKSLQDQKCHSSIRMGNLLSSLQSQVDGVQKDVRVLASDIRVQEDQNDRIEKEACIPMPKRLADKIKGDSILTREIKELRKRVNRETVETDLAIEELAFVQREILRAEQMIARFKRNLTKEQQKHSDDVNNELRSFIETQREEFKRAIKNQKKRNAGLEKQRKELIEEEKMLTNLLSALEKQLQLNMQKLPSLAQLQRKMDLTESASKLAVMKGRRAPDDAEMRSIRKALMQLKSRKIVSKSVIVQAKSFH
jgi:hypothetical protein